MNIDQARIGVAPGGGISDVTLRTFGNQANVKSIEVHELGLLVFPKNPPFKPTVLPWSNVLGFSFEAEAKAKEEPAKVAKK